MPGELTTVRQSARTLSKVNRGEAICTPLRNHCLTPTACENVALVADVDRLADSYLPV